jgi:hypothetical protein
MASKGLTETWRPAWAAKPSDWRIMGLVTGPRVADPAIEGEDWCAWARGPNDERIEGEGDNAVQALGEIFANKMERLRADPNG